MRHRAAGSFLLGAVVADLAVGLGVLLAGVLAGSGAADSLDVVSRDRMLERGLTVAALAISVEIAFVIGGTGVAHALADRPPA